MSPTRVVRETLAALRPGRSWGDLQVLDEVGSTNGHARDLAEWSVVVAERQTAGRGRLGRTWDHRPGLGLALSLRTPSLTPLGWVPLAAGLAVYDTLDATGLDVGLKWPNDLLWIDEGGVERKIAGLLCEAVPGGVVVGVGINVEHGEGDLPLPTAGSVRIAAERAGCRPPTRAELLPPLVDAIRDRLDPLRVHDVRESYRQACWTIGRDVEVHRPDGSVLACHATDVDHDGRLAVAYRGGSDTVTAGDVRHVRHRP